MVYGILPFRNVLKNKYGLIFSTLFIHNKYKVELKNGFKVTLKPTQWGALMGLLGVVNFAMTCNKISENTLEFSFGPQNKFRINFDNLSQEDEKLLYLLFEGFRFGANFITDTVSEKNQVQGNMTIKITEVNKKRIIETNDGLKFYLDSIDPGIIIETYVRKIHGFNSDEDWNGKTVVDVGANVGDTAIYYASKGARVFAFEPIKAHYDAMIKNLGLNPQIANRITPINAGIGKDGMLRFYHDSTQEIGSSASFLYDLNISSEISEVKGYSLKTARSEFKMSNIDLLKMDCRGCEQFLRDEDLAGIPNVKIEYTAYNNAYKVEDFLQMLTRCGYHYMIYYHDPLNLRSLTNVGVAFAKKLQSN